VKPTFLLFPESNGTGLPTYKPVERDSKYLCVYSETNVVRRGNDFDHSSHLLATSIMSMWILSASCALSNSGIPAKLQLGPAWLASDLHFAMARDDEPVHTPSDLVQPLHNL
jgi:hypothetical protein